MTYSTQIEYELIHTTVADLDLYLSIFKDWARVRLVGRGSQIVTF